jgi:hypothetical protein
MAVTFRPHASNFDRRLVRGPICACVLRHACGGLRLLGARSDDSRSPCAPVSTWFTRPWADRPLRVPQRGRRDARTLVDDDGGRGVARGHAGARPRCDLVHDSGQFGFQHREQLDARHGADEHGVFRGVHHHRPDVQPGCREQPRRIYLQCRSAGLFVQSCYSEHSDVHRRWHRQQFLKRAELFRAYHFAFGVHQQQHGGQCDHHQQRLGCGYAI